MIRTPSDFEALSQALPSLQEFSCGFHILKTQAYATMYTIVQRHWPDNITHLNITLDGMYAKANASLPKWRKTDPTTHICLELASRLPKLVVLTYTGRICHQLFGNSRRRLQTQGYPFDTNKTVRSVNLVVHNICCEPLSYGDDTPGIGHLRFIDGFERLIFEAVESCSVFRELRHLRIRYIDLESPAMFLNPTFHLEKGHCLGNVE